jgi:mRNA-degrading endonuclease RelE of RelBE toxin-antitoxin system
MKLIRTQRFLDDYRKLPARVQKQTQRKLQYLGENLGHPSLRVKRVRKYDDVYEGSIDMDYRFLFLITGEGYLLLRIGRHDIIEKL